MEVLRRPVRAREGLLGRSPYSPAVSQQPPFPHACDLIAADDQMIEQQNVDGFCERCDTARQGDILLTRFRGS